MRTFAQYLNESSQATVMIKVNTSTKNKVLTYLQNLEVQLSLKDPFLYDGDDRTHFDPDKLAKRPASDFRVLAHITQQQYDELRAMGVADVTLQLGGFVDDKAKDPHRSFFKSFHYPYTHFMLKPKGVDVASFVTHAVQRAAQDWKLEHAKASERIAVAPHEYYHVSSAKYDIGKQVRPIRDMSGYEQVLGASGLVNLVEGILEKARKKVKSQAPNRMNCSYLFKEPKDAIYWARKFKRGAVVYIVEPVGVPYRVDMQWVDELEGNCIRVHGLEPEEDDPEIGDIMNALIKEQSTIAQNYWNGKPSSKPIWEYLVAGGFTVKRTVSL